MKTLMELIETFSDVDDIESKEFRLREAARGIFFDENNLIPILKVKKYNYHKLPGGGVDHGEDIVEGLKRELLEETGCEIKIDKKVGKIIEYRGKYNLKQISYCYLGKILTKGKPNFTQKETEQGFEITWVELQQAIKLISEDNPFNYDGECIKKRDLKFLQKTLEIL
jgi:8-oxo-dGTP pyrophosphatase MutT (NUDIX family)